jgi:hypothetical protein
MPMVDPLRRDDIERARQTPPSERARQTLELMRLGFRMQRAALRTRYPDDSEAEIEERFLRWLGRG